MTEKIRYRGAPSPGIGVIWAALSAILFVSGLSVLGAQAPEIKENLIYSVVAFDGKDYSGTFCREDADTIYLIGDIDNFVNVKKALVYYWDITQEWKIDLEHLNYTFEGQIELTDKSDNVEILESVKFTYYNAPGEYEINWRVFTGDEADREYAAYDKLMDEYLEEIEAYQNRQMELQVRFEEMIQQLSLLREEEEEVIKRLEEAPAKKRLDEIKDKIEQARRERTNTSQLEQEKAALERDLSPLIEAAARSRLEILAFAELAQRLGEGLPAPEHPGYFVREPDNAFLFNLEPGEYSIRFIIPNGTTLEGSEKRVLVHEKRREKSIGYDVIPADKWTRPVLSQTLASVLYVDGTTDLYLLPYFQDKFNDLYYNKTVRNDARGNPNIMRWVKIQQVPKPLIEVNYPGNRTESFLEQPFYVEQLPGSSFGYKIVPFDTEGEHKDRDPNLIAFHIPLEPTDEVIRFKLSSRDGEQLAGGERQIRIVSKTSLQVIGLLLALLPLVLMVMVLVARVKGRRRFAKLERSANSAVSKS